MLRTLSITTVLLAATSAIADPKLSGQVTDLHGKPLADAVVVVAGEKVEHRAITGADGRYSLDVGAPGTYAVLIVSGRGQMNGYVAVPEGGTIYDGKLDDSAEVVVVRDPKNVQRAKPVKDPRILPKYSDRAIVGDRWARAWVLLDVDETGAVTRMKFLKRPGYDLDELAVEHAFKTKFTPAKVNGVPERSLIVWPIEWPSYWWMIDLDLPPTRMPDTVVNKPCAGSGRPIQMDSLHPVYRDCSLPDLSKMDASEPWITSGSARK
jgi:hypothetical protein